MASRYLKCFGVQDVATKAPMTPDTIFALHSMTKPVTSVAAMMLIDEGKLSLRRVSACSGISSSDNRATE
jgi:CubicO group peptidase (beta-lactamase class C family)